MQTSFPLWVWSQQAIERIALARLPGPLPIKHAEKQTIHMSQVIQTINKTTLKYKSLFKLIEEF